MNEVTPVERWEPDYSRECEVCGRTPCVTAVLGDRRTYEGTMCGMCTWGEAAMRDPSQWNQ